MSVFPHMYCRRVDREGDDAGVNMKITAWHEPGSRSVVKMLRLKVESSTARTSFLRIHNFACLEQPAFTWTLTVLSCHLLGDLNEDPGVADDHDDQRQQKEAAEGEHVVGGFLPVSFKAPPGGALGEVGWMGNGDIVENEHLLD